MSATRDHEETRIPAGEHEGEAVVLATEPGPGPAAGPALPVEPTKDDDGTTNDGTTDQAGGSAAVDDPVE